MALLNVDLPQHFYCMVRAEYLYNQESHHGEYVDCVVFALASVPGRALAFHVMLDNGAQFARLPIEALCHKRGPGMSCSELQLWDCFGDQVTVNEYEFLGGLRALCWLPGGGRQAGEYRFTVDWWGNGYSDTPEQHKNAHFVALDEGCYAALPNNRIYWREASFITSPLGETDRPEYLTQARVYSCESERWTSEDSSRFFYRGQQE